MRKPAVRCGAVPMIDIRRNLHHIARQKFSSLFSAFLIEADAADRNQKLSTGMPVPVVPA